MNWTSIPHWTVISGCILATGCTVYQNALRTLRYEPAAYCWKHDRCRSVELYRQWADQAWREESQSCREMRGQKDYVMGFRDGFVDYVYAGGNGEPPPVPPRQFWNVGLRSPDGKQRVNQWFEGYRHGAQVARAGGYRDLATVQSSLFGIESDPAHAAFPPDAYAPGGMELEVPWPQVEALPEPEVAPISPAPAKSLDEPNSGAIGEPTNDTDAALAPADKPKTAERGNPNEESAPANQPTAEPPPAEEPMPKPDRDDSARDTDWSPSREASNIASDVPAPNLTKTSPVNTRRPESPAAKVAAKPAIATVRFVDGLSLAGSKPPAPPAAALTPSSTRAVAGAIDKPLEHVMVRTSFVATPAPPRSAAAAQSSTIEFRRNVNTLRSPSSSGSNSTGSMFLR